MTIMGGAEIINKTIPKSVELERIDLSMSASHLEGDREHRTQVEKLNNQHTCFQGAIKESSRKSKETDERQTKFIKSLSAPKRIINNVTVEPLAFLTIIALCIELPSIQDLIYTKVCLQLVSNEPDSTFNISNINARSVELNSSETIGDISSSKILPNVTLEFLDGFGGNLSQQLPTNGRIQQSTERQPDSKPQQQLFTSNSNFSRDFSLCYGINRGRIPKRISQKIANQNSYIWLKYQLIICSLCLLSSPYWGGVSDRIGRIIPLNVPIAMSALSNLISLVFGLIISSQSYNQLRVEWLYLGAVLVGLSGGQAVFVVCTFSFISDNTSSENRSKHIAILESVIYLARSIGFYLAKHLMSIGLGSLESPWLNRHFVAFSSSTLLCIICISYSIMKLRHQKFHKFLNNFEREQQENFAGDSMFPGYSNCSIGGGASMEKICTNDRATNRISVVANSERFRELTLSTPDDLDGPVARADKSWTDWGNIITLKYYKQTYLTATKRRTFRNLILSLLFCGFISAMSLACLLSLLYIYLHSDPFNWTTSQYSSWNSISAIVRGIALVSLTICMKFVEGWNVPDPIIAAIGFLSKGTGLLMIALAKSSTLIDWALLAFVLSEFSMPPIRSLLSKLIAKEEVGKIYSCLATMQIICLLVGNIVFYMAYTSLDLQNFFRLSFLTVGIFQYVAVIIMLLTYSSLRHRAILI